MYGNLPPPQLLLDALKEQLATAPTSGGKPSPHGYQCSAGSVEARRALAAAHSYENARLTEDVSCSDKDSRMGVVCGGRSRLFSMMEVAFA